MGCDIHWYSETRRDGKWVCDQAASLINENDVDDVEDPRYDMDNFPHRSRDYWFFGLLADRVRCTWPWSFPQKELPEDVSNEVKRISDQWDCDGHSHSYLSRDELKTKLEELRLERAKNLIADVGTNAMQIDHLISRLEGTVADLNAEVPDEDQRIVFWFDN